VRSHLPDSQQQWVPVYEALNLELIYEFAGEKMQEHIKRYAVMAEMEQLSSPPVIAERFIASKEAYDREFEQRSEALRRTARSNDKILRELAERMRLKREKKMQHEEQERNDREQFSLEF
jgi:hypothetical protein